MRNTIAIIFIIFLAGCTDHQFASYNMKIENPNGSIINMNGTIWVIYDQETTEVDSILFGCQKNMEVSDNYCCYGHSGPSTPNKFTIPILCGPGETLGSHLDKLETDYYFGFLENFDNSLTDGELLITLSPNSFEDNTTGSFGVGQLSDGSRVKVTFTEIETFEGSDLSDVVIRGTTKH